MTLVTTAFSGNVVKYIWENVKPTRKHEKMKEYMYNVYMVSL